MIYFTSDWHFCHDKEFVYVPRGFSSIEQMNKAIVNNHNSVVNTDDDVYVLGDLMLNNNEQALEYIKQLNGNLHIIRGNHDTDERLKLYLNLNNVVEISEAKHFKYNKYHFFLCHYPCLTSNMDIDKPLRARLINLCGHSHTTNKFNDFDKGLIYHVEMDAHDCYPVNIDQIIEEIREELQKEHD